MTPQQEYELAQALQAWARIVARRYQLGLVARNNLAWAHLRAITEGS
jgi:hypothetical protein